MVTAAHEQQGGHLARIQLCGDALQGRQCEVAVLVRRQQAAPGVEQLHRIRARVHLREQQFRHHVRDGGQRFARQRRVAMHERARFAKILAAAAFDAVGEQRERCARETEDAVASVQRLLQMRNGAWQIVDALHDPVELPGVVVRGTAQRPRNARAFTRSEAHTQAHRQRHDQDVGENDGRVERVAIQRFERGARGQLGRLADVPETVLRTQCAIARQIAAGLAHEPDGGSVERVTAQRREETLARMHRTINSSGINRKRTAARSSNCHSYVTACTRMERRG